MMKPEELFIKKLEVYFDEDFNDFTKNRIKTYLREYVDQMPPLVIREKIDKCEKRDYRRAEDTFLEKRRKDFVTNEELRLEAQKLCDENKILIKDFIGGKNIKSRNIIGELRKKFCNLIHEKYLCSNMVLSEFFNVHHSTISFYLYGKTRVLPKQKTK